MPLFCPLLLCQCSLSHMFIVQFPGKLKDDLVYDFRISNEKMPV